ncbi:unnamed protein product [Trichogramma brassicae]|uniref:CCHC-type domain-containing protein n=1 Tax=Trichogramma brassicae TaxID=86971 RepID=A0A6H5ICL2_9HYME|nr:unnamed protein product [Trichogramma brassicae]
MFTICATRRNDKVMISLLLLMDQQRETKETKEKSPKKVNFSDSPDHQETEDELNDQWFSEMKEISLRKEALLQNQLEIAAENQRLMQEMIAEQRNLRAAQEAAQASQEKLRKEQAEATKKLNKISSTLEAILLDSRQQQADKENDPGIEAEKPKRTEREIKEKQPKVNAATVPPIEEIVCYRCTEVGHYSTSCPLVKQGLWYCYVCNAIKRHNSKNCPNKCQEYVQNNSDSNNKTNPKGRNMRGAGRGRGRSSFRGKRFTHPTLNVQRLIKQIVRVMRQTAREGVSAMSRSPYQCEPYVRVWKRAAVDEATARSNSHDSLSPFHASTCVSLTHSTENLAAKQSSTREFFLLQSK